MSGKDIHEMDEKLTEAYFKGFFDGKEFEGSKQIKKTKSIFCQYLHISRYGERSNNTSRR